MERRSGTILPLIKKHTVILQKQKLGLLFNRVLENQLTATAAQSTYYLILSFFPFLIFLITLISYTPLLQEEVLFELRPFLPEEAFDLVMDNVQDLMDSRRGTLMSTGMLVTVFLASNGVAAIIRGINKAYRNTQKRVFWKERGIALVFTLAITLLILLSLLFLVFGQMVGMLIIDLLELADIFQLIWQWARIGVSLAFMILIFSLLYRFSPNQYVTLRQSVPGAIFTTFGWLILSYGFAFYVNNFNNYSVTYGSIGAIMVLLTWLYLSSIIILLGSEINAWRIKSSE